MTIEPRDLRWLVDDVIPHTPALSALMGDVTVMPGRAITRDAVSDIDILLVRSITPVNAALLSGSRVQFVGTATAGIDHFDVAAITELGLTWSAAPGSNAVSVVEYVLTALAETEWLTAVLSGSPVGLVGLGQVGGRLAARLIRLGATVMAYDPNIEPWPAGVVKADLNTVLQQPVISLHASLHDSAPFASREMIGAEQARTMVSAQASRQGGGLFINAGRGDLMSPEALKVLLESPWTVVLDTWPGEPVLEGDTLAEVNWISPHIAGHSAQARERGSDMLAASISRWSTGQAAAASQPSASTPRPPLEGLATRTSAGAADWLMQFLLDHSVLPREDARVRAHGMAGLSAADFDALRSRYAQPNEWTGECIKLVEPDPEITDVATRLGVLVSGEEEER